MAKKINKDLLRNKYVINPPHMSTSIGMGDSSKPKNKHKRRNWKKYRGQG